MGAVSQIFSGFGMGLVGTGMSTAAAYQGALASRQAAELNAQTYEQNAQLALIGAQKEREAGEVEYRDTIREYEALRGQQAAAYGASGVSVNAGSPLAVTSNTAAEGVYEAQKTQYQRDLAAWKLEQEAANYKFEAAKSRATGSSVNPWLSAGAAAIGGLTDTYATFGGWSR